MAINLTKNTVIMVTDDGLKNFYIKQGDVVVKSCNKGFMATLQIFEIVLNTTFFSDELKQIFNNDSDYDVNSLFIKLEAELNNITLTEQQFKFLLMFIDTEFEHSY